MTMQASARRGIGLLGGTFDPVHAGHLALAAAAASVCRLACVDFVPAGAPWQKGFVTAAHHRLQMLRMALEGEPAFRVNEIELLRSGPTYTIETLAEMRSRLGPSYPLVLILGGDQWQNLHTWKDWERLADYASLAVASRDGAPLEAAPEVEAWAAERLAPAEALSGCPAGRVARFSMMPHRASATVIRRLIGRLPFAEAARRLDGWLDADVSAYIFSKALYGASQRKPAQ